MTTPDSTDDRPAGDGASPPGLPEPDLEQGPVDDDPADGLLVDDSLSIGDRDLVEPGLDEAELGLAELAEGTEERPFPADELGTPDGDEASVAADELDEDAGLVEGSEPADVPGATDDLFPADSAEDSVRDAGEEGLDEDFSESLDDSVHAGDVAWRQSGPSDEDDDLGGGLRVPACGDGAGSRMAARVTRVERPSPVRLLGDCRGSRIEGAPPEGGGFGVRFLRAAAALRRESMGPPLRFPDEEQRVVSLGFARGPHSNDPAAIHAATDRAMIFRWIPGAADWVVADSFVAQDGTVASWLRLGVSRVPFRLVSPSRSPALVLAWRAGGPLLFAEGAGPWRVREAGGSLRAVVEDEQRGELLLFAAVDESGLLRVVRRDDTEERIELPASVADVLLGPGAVVAARGGDVWAGCLDPELAAMHSEDGGRSWRAVPALRATRALVRSGGGRRGVLAVCGSSADESDELWFVAPDGAVRCAVRAGELDPGRGSAARFEGLSVEAANDRVWVLCGGRLFAIGPEGTVGGESA